MPAPSGYWQSRARVEYDNGIVYGTKALTTNKKGARRRPLQ
jgi:hypothetical protein